MQDQKKTVNTNEFHYFCERCGSDFVIPANSLNSLMTASTHCSTCVSVLSAKFSAYFSKAGK